MIKKGTTITVFMVDQKLYQQIKAIIQVWRENHDRYETVSSFIKHAMYQYQQQTLQPADYRTGQKRRVQVKLLPADLAFYRSLPVRERYRFINALLKGKLEKELLALEQPK